MRIFKKRKDARNWTVEFKDPLEVVRRLALFPDKRASEQAGRKIESMVACRMAGEGLTATLTQWVETIPGRVREQLAKWGVLDSSRYAAGMPLPDHLDAWHKSLLAKGNTKKHAQKSKNRVATLFENCGFQRWSNIDPAKVERRLSAMRIEGIGPVTSNYYLQAAKGFCKWMVENGRATKSPIEFLKGVKVETGIRVVRRALTDEEVIQLLTTTYNSSDSYEISGPDRAMLYKTALNTGLRSSELRSLRRSNFFLSLPHPHVVVEAAYSKNRKMVRQPLKVDFATELQSYLCHQHPRATALKMPSERSVARMLAKDCQAAGIQKYDESGRVVDFHALRHTFITNLTKSGIDPKTAQLLARHSSISLTMDRYTHIRLDDVALAVEKLPTISTTNQEVLNATGTGGSSESGASGGPFLGSKDDISRHPLTEKLDRTNDNGLAAKPYESKDKLQMVSGAGGGT